MASLQEEIERLTDRLAKVTAEKERLVRNGGDECDDDETSSWEEQCQRYEEKIVELHSVIAELTRKLGGDGDDVIREESEFEEEEEESNVSDSYVDDEDDEGDYSSVACERNLEDHRRSRNMLPQQSQQQQQSSNQGFQSATMLLQRQMMMREEEMGRHMDELRRELAMARLETSEARESASRSAAEAEVAREEAGRATAERDSVKRQLDDVKATVEYQEARMDAGGGEARKPSRSSSERRSLRRRRNKDEFVASGDKKVGLLRTIRMATCDGHEQIAKPRSSVHANGVVIVSFSTIHPFSLPSFCGFCSFFSPYFVLHYRAAAHTVGGIMKRPFQYFIH